MGWTNKDAARTGKDAARTGKDAAKNHHFFHYIVHEGSQFEENHSIHGIHEGSKFEENHSIHGIHESSQFDGKPKHSWNS
jgi:hypothetical protein